jgi:dTDP-4-amino-4,6-dideoxygalactose transaminase
MYSVLLSSPEERDRVLAELRGSGIDAVFHYVPLHLSDGGRRYGRTSGTLERTERASSCLIRLPLWPDMSSSQIERVLDLTEAALSRA